MSVEGGPDADVIEVALGEGARRALVRFMESWAGIGCQHVERPQVALASELTSCCWGCAVGSGAVETWARGAGCTVCGRGESTADRLWFVPLTPDSTAALRLCADCSRRELNPRGERMKGICELCGHVVASAIGDMAAFGAGSDWRGVPDLLHPDCREGWRQALRLRVEDHPDLTAPQSRRLRIAELRMRFAL